MCLYYHPVVFKCWRRCIFVKISYSISRGFYHYRNISTYKLFNCKNKKNYVHARYGRRYDDKFYRLYFLLEFRHTESAIGVIIYLQLHIHTIDFMKQCQLTLLCTHIIVLFFTDINITRRRRCNMSDPTIFCSSRKPWKLKL